MEDTILENVCEALKDSPDELELFLEPFCHGCVLIDGARDLTQPLFNSRKIISLAHSGKAASSPSTSVSRKRSGGESSPGSLPNPPTEDSIVIGRRGDRRKHHRIAFKGVPGRALTDLKRLQELLRACLEA